MDLLHQAHLLLVLVLAIVDQTFENRMPVNMTYLRNHSVIHGCDYQRLLLHSFQPEANTLVQESFAIGLTLFLPRRQL